MTPDADPPAITLILASASPARARLLDAAGVRFTVQVSAVDEDAAAAALTNPTPERIACELAAAKASAVAAALGWPTAHNGTPQHSLAVSGVILGCDSVLEVPGVPELAGKALGKPNSVAEAASRWRLMRGHTGLLHTGHGLRVRGTTQSGRDAVLTRAEVVTTEVLFSAQVDDPTIDAYAASGEPLSVAGAFTIDGRGMALIDGIVGDHSNVIGLSVPRLRTLLQEFGVSWTAVTRR